MTTNTFLAFPLGLAVSALLLLVPAAGAQAPAANPPEPSVSLKLDESILLENTKLLKVEQMENGGIRVSGTVAEEQTGDPGFYFTKTFSNPMPASAIRFELEGVERAMGVQLTNEEGKAAFRHYFPQREDALDFLTFHYNGSAEEETFSGKVKKFGLFIPTPMMAGEFVIEISKIELVP